MLNARGGEIDQARDEVLVGFDFHLTCTQQQHQTLHLTTHDMDTSKQEVGRNENSTLVKTPPNSNDTTTIALLRDDSRKESFESTTPISLTSSNTIKREYLYLFG
jgi:hypothetical protein